MLQERVLDRDLRIHGNPFGNRVHSTEYLSLIEQSDTRITIKITTVNEGAPYVKNFQPWIKWEFMSPDPRSQRVVLRTTYNIHWLKKPLIGSGIIED